MRLRRQSRLHSEMKADSMSDIMFFLMLFFLIVSTLVNPNVIKLMLPNSKSNSSMAKQPIILSINAEKIIFVNKEQVAIEDLESKLKAETKSKENPTVVLRIDQSLTIQDLVNVMQIGNALKLKMVLATNQAK